MHLRKLRGLLKARTQLNFSITNYQLWYVWRLATIKGYQRFSSSNLHCDLIPGPLPCLLWAVSQKYTLRSTGIASELLKRAAVTQRLSRRQRRCPKDALQKLYNALQRFTTWDFTGMEWVAEVLLQAVTQFAGRSKVYNRNRPLLPMFSKPSARLPARIERWFMDMQDVMNLGEMNWILQISCRHPLPAIENDDTEKLLKAVITKDHAVVLDRVREDRVLRKLSQTIQKRNWESSKRHADLIPFYQVIEELFGSQGMIFHKERIILPANLQQKIIKSANTLGHLGMTKTKHMLRGKCWFTGMNLLISQISGSGSCFDCPLATKSHRKEPNKPSVIPEEAWEQISIDFGEPYPDHQNLVATDQRTWYPVVKLVSSTGFKQTKEKLKKTFAFLDEEPQKMDHHSIQSNLKILQRENDSYIIE